LSDSSRKEKSRTGGRMKEKKQTKEVMVGVEKGNIQPESRIV